MCFPVNILLQQVSTSVSWAHNISIHHNNTCTHIETMIEGSTSCGGQLALGLWPVRPRSRMTAKRDNFHNAPSHSCQLPI